MPRQDVDGAALTHSRERHLKFDSPSELLEMRRYERGEARMALVEQSIKAWSADY